MYLTKQADDKVPVMHAPPMCISLTSARVGAAALQVRPCIAPSVTVLIPSGAASVSACCACEDSAQVLQRAMARAGGAFIFVTSPIFSPTFRTIQVMSSCHQVWP